MNEPRIARGQRRHGGGGTSSLWRSALPFMVLLLAIICAAPTEAQEAKDNPPRIRFLTRNAPASGADSTESVWVGTLERVTADSIGVSLDGEDRVLYFRRTAMQRIEVATQAASPAKAAAIGCVTVGGIFTLLTSGGGGNADVSIPAGLPFAVGCTVGAVGSMLLFVGGNERWVPFELPS